eukprot:TRINITY_DN212_c0_g5_i5.p1 TRINITY_DN212_c0_g5~~TRINITY_DN212_c0_g5_i5.p1  ORF type:complete len:1247 (-),score=410.29 TRINITY_DN212_c0_g5_i5:2155-5895(-)
MKNSNTQRFSLLMLQEGEHYFDDFSAFMYPSDVRDSLALKRRIKGRLKLCSMSLVFVPDDSRLAITRLPFDSAAGIEKWTAPLVSSLSGKAELFAMRTTQVVEMYTNNVAAPYKFISTAESGTTSGGGNSSSSSSGGDDVSYRFSLNYVSLSTFLLRARELIHIARLPIMERETRIRHITEQRERMITFDPGALVKFSERRLKECFADRVSPFASNAGRIVVTNSRLYFQPFNNVDAVAVTKYNFAHIVRLVKRRHMLRSTGLEIFFEDDRRDVASSVFFAFQSIRERDKVISLLQEQEEMVHLQTNDSSNMSLKWQNGAISNYEYLMYLNYVAGRTKNDYTQYPVFPWVIADYENATLDLSNPNMFRDLSKPIGALNPARLKQFHERYEHMPDPKFLYGTHYSTPGYVLYYLVRDVPEYMLRLQNGRFDHPDRIFFSIADTWNSVMTNNSDLKELIPEFYEGPSGGSGRGETVNFLENTENLDFGNRQDGTPVGDVELPPWASDSDDFLTKCRDALESDYVSANLHNWIDLIFGYKQRGAEAVRHDNLFYHLTYEGAVDLDAITDPVERESLQAQINEFGQTPSQLFTHPHPRRLPQESRRGGTLNLHTILPLDDLIMPLSSSSVSSHHLTQPSPAQPTLASILDDMDKNTNSNIYNNNCNNNSNNNSNYNNNYNNNSNSNMDNNNSNSNSNNNNTNNNTSFFSPTPSKAVNSNTYSSSSFSSGSSSPSSSSSTLPPAESSSSSSSSSWFSTGLSALRSLSFSPSFAQEEETPPVTPPPAAYTPTSSRSSASYTPTVTSPSPSATRTPTTSAELASFLPTSYHSPSRPRNNFDTGHHDDDHDDGIEVISNARRALDLEDTDLVLVVDELHPSSNPISSSSSSSTAANSSSNGVSSSSRASSQSLTGFSPASSPLTNTPLTSTTSSNAHPFTLWNATSELKYKFAYRLHRDAVSCVCLSRSGDTLYSVSQDTSLKIYSLEEKRQLRSTNLCELALSCCALDRDEKSVVIGSWDNSLYIYSIDYGRVLDNLCAHDDAVSCIDMTDDLLVSGSWDSTIKVWQRRRSGLSKTPVLDLFDCETEVRTVALNYAGTLLAAGTDDGGVYLYDLRQGTRAIAGGGGGGGAQHIATHDDVVKQVKFTPDGRRIISCSSDQTLKVIDIVSGVDMMTMNTGEPLTCLATDGQSVLIAGERGRLRKWELQTGTEVNLTKCNNIPKIAGGLTCMSTSANCESVVCGAQNSHIYWFGSD